MFDEDGRKIDFGKQIGMSLEGMSVPELQKYIEDLKSEIQRVQMQQEKLQSHNDAAEALFK